MLSIRLLRHALLLAALLLAAGRQAVRAQADRAIPHNQERPPGPALSPEEARRMMKVPEGFQVELFASEPDIVNPVTMTFDERGRIWITESLEYPRLEAGPGRDRVKILEDTDGDGKADKFTVFAEGLNIPCGIAMGDGGVYVTNSPDILFLADTDGDDHADKTSVLLTGFGRHDTHELPNTLTWGPDGWLYGFNGVFNPAEIKHQEKEHRFTCALWRLHPRTLAFELFAEGTSNPWGVAFDREGSAFCEACVIDHLYHLVETGYYHRQAGSYPPFTWKIESVVKHQHQKAAYCGLAIYDADAYPETYRGRIFMGNIHGNCVNMDRLERHGSTYLAQAEPDFLNAADVWFMPVAIKLGPDGFLYVLDWYDRYHCYQDARRDPAGIDRGRGRLWRIAYGKPPAPKAFDLKKESSLDLIRRLESSNRFWREEARRLLAQRRDESAYPRLKELALGSREPRTARLEALWTLIHCEEPDSEPRALDREFHLQILAHADPGFRAWGVRAAGDLRRVDAAVRDRVPELAADESPDVRLQVAIASRKLLGEKALPALLSVLAHSADDPLIPRIVWRNLEPLLETQGAELIDWLAAQKEGRLQATQNILGRIVERLLARKEKDLRPLARLVRILLENRGTHAGPTANCLAALSRAASSGELDEDAQASLRDQLATAIAPLTKAGRGEPLYVAAVTLAAAWKEPQALAACRSILLDPKEDVAVRAQAMEALAGSRDDSLLEAAASLLNEPGGAPPEFLKAVFAGLGRLETPRVAAIILAGLGALPAGVQPQAIDLLTQRPPWASALLDAIKEKKLEARQLNTNQVRRILALGDEALERRVIEIWGILRRDRNPERENLVERMKKVLAASPGDPWAGKAVYEKTCAQCHVLFGKGSAVGPDITASGRETLDQLLSNLLDPNLVIGKDYQARTLLTRSGRVLNGLLLEESPQRVVIKVAGGKEEVVPSREVEALSVSEVSLMPEELEKTISQDEFRDLIAYLRYDEAPPEPVATTVARKLPESERRIAAEQSYGEVKVSARFPGRSEGAEVLRYLHSNDQRPYIHPLRAPGGGPVLTAFRPDDHPWQYGVFTGHAQVNGIDFWHEKGWIRSRGLVSVVEKSDRVEIVSRSDWLTQRRGGERLLVEEQVITVHAPERPDRYAVDFEWRLTPDVEVTFGRYDYGGLAFRPANHSERRHEGAASPNPAEAMGRPWLDMSGRFGEGASGAVCGAAIFDHPANPSFPGGWRADGQGLINPAISLKGPLALPAGKTATFRYRLLVHAGHGEREMLEAEYRRWASDRASPGGSRSEPPRER